VTSEGLTLAGYRGEKQRERKNMARKTLIYNDDGWSSTMRYPAPMSPEDLVRVTVAPLIGTAVRVYQFCALGGHAVNYRSSFLPRLGEMMERVDTLHVWRMRETLRHLDSLGTDPLHVIAAACHQHGLACQYTLRMNDAHHTYRRPDGSWYFPELQSPWFEAHPEALLPNRQLDYAQPVVHEYRQQQIQEVLDHYDVDGLDLDFTRFKPWFQAGQEESGRPRLTDLVRQLRQQTRAVGKTLSARLEYDPEACLASGLDVETLLAEGLFDQITLGGTGDHTPDAPADWWIEQAQTTGCKVYPGVEGQLHWIPSCGGGGMGTRPARDGVQDGFGPPSLAYLRAVAAVHYQSGAAGLSLFNFTCADGPFSRDAFTELADPDAIQFRDKQYVAAVWPWDAQIYHQDWTSRFRLESEEAFAAYSLRLADDLAQARERGYDPLAVLTLDLKGLNRVSDVEVALNGTPLAWNGFAYNHYDHGCWNDTLQFTVPVAALRKGENALTLRRLRENPGFAGAVEVRKCLLEIAYGGVFTPGWIGRP
jgi:hypothetical protein